MKTNTLKYKAALQAIADGYWSVDAERGHLVGPRGAQIGTVQESGYVMARPPARYWRAGTAVYVHRVIWESQNGSLASELQVNHKNGLKHDTGLKTSVGEGHPFTHLREAQVLEIYSRAWRGECMELIGAEFAVVPSTVGRI